MAFPFVKAKYDWRREGKPPSTNKYFYNGIQEEREWEWRAKWYEEVSFCPGGNLSWGELIYKSLDHVERNNLPWLHIPDKILKKERDGTFRLSGSHGYLATDTLRETIQFDIDLEQDGSAWNSLTIEERWKVILSKLPWLDGVECVVQLSNKAFLPTYPDKLCLRIYVRLKTPTTNLELREIFKAFRPVIDINMFATGAVHLVQPPTCAGNVKREIVGSTLLHVPGSTLDLDDVRATDEYSIGLGQAAAFTESIKGIGTWTEDCEEYQNLIQLAREGYFYQNRSTLHYQILAEAVWVNQSGEEIADLLAKDTGVKEGFDYSDRERKTIMGNRRTRKTLEEQLKAIKQRNIKHFISPIGDRRFDYVANDPQEADLQNADLSDFYGRIASRLRQGGRVGAVIKSGHGSSKTTVVAPKIEEIVKHCVAQKRTMRYLYISTLKSIIKGTCPKLKLTCYTGDTDRPVKEIITNADRLGICLLSLQHLYGVTPFDLVVVDESEHVGFWADWKNDNHNRLIDILAQSRCFVLLDADASDLTYSILDRACRYHEAEKILCENTVSWISIQSQFLNFVRKQRDIDALIADYAIDDDELCFVHVDDADKDGSKTLSTKVELFNEIAGYEIAKKYDDNSPHKELLELYKDPNKTIESLYEAGIRIIIVSPVIVSGWRYTGKYRFSKTFGIYKNDFFTAPIIIQRIQRVIEVREHFIYINPQSNWTPLAELEQQISDYAGISEVRGKGLFDRELDKVELKLEATSIRERFKGNVKLHLLLLWSMWGGQSRYWEYCPSDERDYEALKTILVEKKEQEEYEEALAVLSNPELLEAITSYFCCKDGKQIEPPTTTDEVLELLKIWRNEQLHYEHALEITNILVSSEADWIRWSLTGAPWIVNNTEQAALTNAPSEFGYRVLGKLLHEIQRRLPLDLASNLIEWMAIGTTPLVIERASLDKQNILQIADNYKTLLNNRYDFYRKNIKGSNFVASMFERVFNFEVEKTPVKKADRVKAKHRIIEHYMRKGWLPLRKTPPVTTYIQKINKAIKAKIKAGSELTDEERIYLEDTDILVVVHHPNTQTKRVFHAIRQAYKRHPNSNPDISLKWEGNEFTLDPTEPIYELEATS